MQLNKFTKKILSYLEIFIGKILYAILTGFFAALMLGGINYLNSQTLTGITQTGTGGIVLSAPWNIDAGWYQDMNNKMLSFSGKIILSSVTIGNSCTTGMIATDSTGSLLACKSGVWGNSSGTGGLAVIAYGGSYNVCVVGDICAPGDCLLTNKATGTCTCPSGFTARQAIQAYDHLNNTATKLYLCEK